MEQQNKCNKRIAISPLGFRDKSYEDYILQSFLSDFEDVRTFPASHKSGVDYESIRLCEPDMIVFLVSEEKGDSVVPVGYMNYKTRRQMLDLSESEKLVLEISECFNKKRRYPLNHHSFFCLHYNAVKNSDYFFNYQFPMIRVRFDFISEKREENLALIKEGILNYFNNKEE